MAAHLHLDDPGLLRFEARVVSTIGLDGRPAPILDRIELSAREYAPEPLAALPLRRESTLVVVVEDGGATADVSPYGGTRVRRTGSVGAQELPE